MPVSDAERYEEAARHLIKVVRATMYEGPDGRPALGITPDTGLDAVDVGGRWPYELLVETLRAEVDERGDVDLDALIAAAYE
jgi:hypothetical protein